jgi:hypothetical protein
MKIQTSLEQSSVCPAGRLYHGTQTQNYSEEDRGPEDKEVNGVVSMDNSVSSGGIKTLILPENIPLDYCY